MRCVRSCRRVGRGFFFVAAAAILSACPPPAPECGNGVVEDGESETTCCEDTGCEFGLCGASNACEDEWTQTCAAAGEGSCIENSSAVCGANPADVPTSDCTQCGCADEDRCEDQVCVNVDTRDAERNATVPPNDLETTDFLALVESANSLEVTFGQIIADHRAVMRADRRAATLLIGRVGDTSGPLVDDGVDEGAGAEAKIAARYASTLRRLRAGDVVIAEDGRLPRDFARDFVGGDAEIVTLASELNAACVDVESLTRDRASDESVAVIFADAIRIHRESCFLPALAFVCTHPHLDGCAERSGTRPLSLLVMSTALVLDRIERALLVRIGNQQANVIDTRLEQSITQWLDLVSNLARPARYRVELDDGEVVYVRARATQSRDGYVALVIEDRQPWGLSSFRVLWNDAPTQAFFVQQDITAADCVYNRVGDDVLFRCDDDGAQVNATIDLVTRTITANERIPRP